MKKKFKKWRWYKIPGRKTLICYVGKRSFGFNFLGEWTDSFNMDPDIAHYQDWIRVSEEEVKQRLSEMTEKAADMNKILNILGYE